jgi:post-segregation antitoxin (ccd killing protein)
MPINTEILNIRISKEQKQTLDKLKGYNVNVSQFVRNAIKEKIERDYDDLKEKSKKEYCPF